MAAAVADNKEKIEEKTQHNKTVETIQQSSGVCPEWNNSEPVSIIHHELIIFHTWIRVKYQDETIQGTIINSYLITVQEL